MKHKTAKANVRTRTGLLSLLLAVLMMLFCFPVTALGTDEAEEPISETLEETADAGLSAFERGVGELSPEALENMTLNAADVPEVISAQAIAEKDHVLRLREQEENLNTVVFQNRDGGKTVYLYANPVKYVDANGNVKDKSTALKAENITLNGKTYSHSATENVFGQYYPTMPQNGVLITFGQYTVEMAPVITGILTLRDTAVANNKVTYNKVFGNGTRLVYTPTLSGVKEDIILQTYTGKSSFSFTLKTNGLAIVQTESDTFLADFEGKKVASLGKVVITDKVGKTAYGTMTVIAVAEREEYTVTINAPVEFLTSSATVYPVTVDPTLVINETYESGLDDYGNAQYSTAIEDLCVYDGTANPVYDDIATIGSYSGNYKSAMLYRIKADAWSGMNLDAYVNNIRFGSASLNVEVDSLYSKIGVSVSPFYGSWNNGTSQNVESMFIDYQFDSNSNRTTINNNTNNTASINVTNIFKYWINNPNSVNYGMILYVDNTILSGTYQNSFNVYQLEESSSSVYISIEYSSFNGSYYINSLESGKFLTGSSVASVSQGIYNGPTYQGWTFTYQGANKYIISLTANTNRVLCVDDNFCIAIGSKSSMEESFYTWQLSFYEDTVTMYNIGSGEYLVPSGTNVIGSSMDDFYGHWRVCRTNAFVPLESVTIADIVMEVGETATPTITTTPANATWVSASDFSWSSSNASVATISTNRVITALGIDVLNFTVIHKVTGIPDTFSVEVEPLLIYRTRNRERLGFADPKNKDDITPITHEDLTFGLKSTNTLITNNTYISLTDLYDNIIDQNPLTLPKRMSEIEKFYSEKIDSVSLCNVFKSMMDHFTGGSGTDYSNSDLTNAIVSNIRTTEYTQGVISRLNTYLNNNSGDISGLYYDENLWIQPVARDEHPMVSAMKNTLSEPCYGPNCEEPGLILCVDSLYGNKFEIQSYELNGNNYTGTLKFTFYDHFGLDTSDLSDTKKFKKIDTGLTAGLIPAFRQWFILQHWDSLNYSTQPKPFVTVIEFTVPFSGTID